MILLRHPVLPVNLARELNSCRTLEELDSVLLRLLKNPKVSEALSLSKTEYWNDLNQSLDRNPGSIADYRVSLLRFINRMCFRTSSYQAMSGISLPSSPESFIQTTPQVNQLFENYESLPLEDVRFRRNPTFWTDGTTMLLWSFQNKAIAGKKPSFDPKIYLTEVTTAVILSRLGSRSWSFDELSTYFSKFMSQDLIKSRIEDLLSQELLMRDPEYFSCVHTPEFSHVRFNGKAVVDLNLNPESKEQQFNQLFTDTKSDPQIPLEELTDANEIIELLSFMEYDKWRPVWLDLLKEDFLQQFHSNNISLLEVVNKLDLNIRRKHIENEIEKSMEEFLFNVIESEGNPGAEEIALSSEHVSDLRLRVKKAQIRREPSWSYMSLVIKDEEKGFWPKLVLCGGANRLLGTYAFYDKVIAEDVKARWEKEKKLLSPAIMAEVISRLDVPASNFAHRVTFADYDIPINGHSELPPEQQIPLSDLRVSVLENRFVLHSEKLQKQIIPVATHKIIWSVTHPVEKFLLSIGVQNQIAGMSWGVERMIRRDYYPRLTYKGIVLSPRKWAINSAFLKKHLYRNDLWEFLHERFGIERYVQHLDHDRSTYIDFSSLASKLILRKLCDTWDRLVFAEEFGSRSDGEGYVMEYLVPIEGKGPKNFSKSHFPIHTEYNPESVQSVLGLHIRLEAKWYNFIISEVLPDVLSDISSEVKPSHWFYIMYTTQESEIRLRFFGLKNNDAIVRTMKIVTEGIEAKLGSMIKSTDIVPYVRSHNHYGSVRGNEIYEWLSFLDSQSTLRFHKFNFAYDVNKPILPNLSEMQFEREILWFLISAQTYLEDFITLGLSEAEINHILLHRSTHWRKSAEAGSDFTPIHKYFRENRGALLELIFDKNHFDNSFLMEAHQAMKKRSTDGAAMFAELVAGKDNGASTTDLPHYIFRLIHMHKVRVTLKINLETESLLLNLLSDLHKQRQLKRNSHAKSKS